MYLWRGFGSKGKLCLRISTRQRWHKRKIYAAADLQATASAADLSMTRWTDDRMKTDSMFVKTAKERERQKRNISYTSRSL